MQRWLLLTVLLTATVAAQDRNASLTVDLVFLGRSMPQMTEALAMFLERGGMDNLELAQPGVDIKTDYKLSATFDGEWGKAFTEIRATLTDRDGKTVWTTRATPQDADWQKLGMREPMQGMILLIERLRPVLKLGESFGETGHEGKFARLMAERSSPPPDSERSALDPRLQALKRASGSATLAIYAPNAARLAELITSAGLAKAAGGGVDPEIHVAANMNEQRMLWDAARGFREFVRKSPPNADYALYAEYLGTDAVHFIVSDRAGEWVIVDFQNDHHPDFQSIAPKSPDDCARLVVKRLQAYLR